MAARIEINPVGNFDVHGDKLGQTWQRWHRSFELYATGKGVTDEKQKKALLLHCAGLDVQDIYFTLEEEEGDDEYQKTVKTLKKHFDSKLNFSAERYKFGSIRQLETETIDQYVTGLRQQAVLCDFADPDAQLRDQEIEKCRSHKLHTRLLEKGPGLPLDAVQTIARTLEMAEKQAREIEGANNSGAAVVNRIQKSTSQRVHVKPNSKQGMKCYRCGKEGHFGKDPCCPANGKMCNKCGKIGHFRNVCKSKQVDNAKYQQKYRKGKYVHHVKNDSDDEYAFTVENKKYRGDEIEIEVGSIKLKVVIDSGASVNIISSLLWED